MILFLLCFWKNYIKQSLLLLSITRQCFFCTGWQTTSLSFFGIKLNARLLGSWRGAVIEFICLILPNLQSKLTMHANLHVADVNQLLSLFSVVLFQFWLWVSFLLLLYLCCTSGANTLVRRFSCIPTSADLNIQLGPKVCWILIVLGAKLVGELPV